MSRTADTVQENIQDYSIGDLVQNEYRDYWRHANLSKSTFRPVEQLMAVEKHILIAAKALHMRAGDHHKTVEVSGETSKYHMSSEATIQDSIKGMAQNYRREPACRFFYPIGNLGSSPDDQGAAARYTAIGGTPLMERIHADMPYVPWQYDDRMGNDQPVYLSCPLPMNIIRGVNQIGMGKSTIIAERKASDVLEWMRDRYLDGNQDTPIPEPTFVGGSQVRGADPDNGDPYVHYTAVWHREGNYDIITNIPPKKTIKNVVAKLGKHLPKKVFENIVDGSEAGKPVWLKVPKGHLGKLKSLFAVDLESAQQEQPFIWDDDLDTMRMSSFQEIADIWFRDRCDVVTRRLEAQIASEEAAIHKIDLIKVFVEKKCQGKKIAEIEKIFGKEDAAILLAMSVKTFLPEKVQENELIREKRSARIAELQSDIDNIEEFVLQEAEDTIQEQEEFFANIDE